MWASTAAGFDARVLVPCREEAEGRRSGQDDAESVAPLGGGPNRAVLLAPPDSHRVYRETGVSEILSIWTPE